MIARSLMLSHRPLCLPVFTCRRHHQPQPSLLPLLTVPQAIAHMQGMPTSEAFEADVEMPLSHLLDHLQDRSRKQDFKLYLAQKGIAEVLPGLEQQVGPVPFPVANSRLQKSSIWLGPAGESVPLPWPVFQGLIAASRCSCDQRTCSPRI